MDFKHGEFTVISKIHYSISYQSFKYDKEMDEVKTFDLLTKELIFKGQINSNKKYGYCLEDSKDCYFEGNY